MKKNDKLRMELEIKKLQIIMAMVREPETNLTTDQENDEDES